MADGNTQGRHSMATMAVHSGERPKPRVAGELGWPSCCGGAPLIERGTGSC